MHGLLVAAWRVHLGARVQRVTMEIPGFVDSTGLITLSDMLTIPEEQSTEMHELGHIALNRFSTGDPFADRITEDLCDEWAAIRLVPDVVLALATALGRDRRELAEIAGVDTRLVDARLRLAGLADWGLETGAARAVR